jgi:hypothetical protein
MADEEAHFRPLTPPYPPPDFIPRTPSDTLPETHPFLPEQDYETDMSTYHFIYFVQDYTPFLRNYLDYLYDERYIEYDDHGYYNSFIDICNNIDTDEGDDGTYETYRVTLEPFMEWMTEECGKMNLYYEEDLRRDKEALAQQNVPKPKGVASRTRSKASATRFEIPQIKKRRKDAITLSEIKEGPIIKLSDKREYTQGEVKHMWDWNKTMTPYRHPYTQEDKDKIDELMGFAKGLKKKTRKARKVKKVRKTKKTRKQKKSRKSKK